eukprot:RCo003881
MAAPEAKKGGGKKKKGTKQNLSEFLDLQKPITNWADDEGDLFGDAGESRRPFQQRPFADEGQKALPDKPPYTLFAGNVVPYASEESIAEFFKCETQCVRRTIDRETGQPKGSCFIEFPTRDALEKALRKNGQEFEGRPLRLDVAAGKQGGGGRGGGDRERG